MKKYFGFAAIALFGFAGVSAAQIVFNEGANGATDGDLGFTVPLGEIAPITPTTVFTLSSPGTLTVNGNTIDAGQDDTFAPGGVAGDLDVFGIVVEEGVAITDVIFDAVGSGGPVFLGLVEDSQLSINPAVSPGNQNFESIATGLALAGIPQTGFSILDDLIDGLPDNAPAFPPAGGILDAGTYVFSIQNTGTNLNVVTSYGITFVATAIPEPTSLLLVSLAGVGLAGKRRRV